MARHEIRRGRPLGQWKYPLTTLWLLADLRGDTLTKIKVQRSVKDIIDGHTESVPRRYYEHWLEVYLYGDQ